MLVMTPRRGELDFIQPKNGWRLALKILLQFLHVLGEDGSDRLLIDADLLGDFGEWVSKPLPPNSLPQSLGHLPVGIDLWHNGGESLYAAPALEARHIKVDGH
jgi:hypothetical protein